ncbi:sialate O-acetylesterase [Saccharicrinis aurantiacus]|uniref:sialate O-acetylesterase n=1 Tax=Saccharicrinis aurantiacus TaxID=1849719 RepID=UPI00094F8080|nr:sialate O-acetylesterase [Saccharicrinis aurantiacus]
MNKRTFLKNTLLIVSIVLSINLFATSPKKPVYVVLLAGQSNMAGSGCFDNIDAENMQKIENLQSKVAMATKNKLAPVGPHLSKGKSEKFKCASFFGPEMGIAISLCEKFPDREFLFIKHSMGGTALYGAWSPEWSLEKSKAVEKGEQKQNVKLYDEHITLIKEQLARLKKEGTPYVILGMAWMQGENDAAKEVSARSYEANLKQLINCYRTEFNAPNMPFVFGQINSNYGRFKEGPAMVRKAFVDVAEIVPNTAVIKTVNDGTKTWNDYPKHFDNVHYNAEGQIKLGKAMGSQLILLQ